MIIVFNLNMEYKALQRIKLLQNYSVRNAKCVTSLWVLNNDAGKVAAWVGVLSFVCTDPTNKGTGKATGKAAHVNWIINLLTSTAKLLSELGDSLKMEEENSHTSPRGSHYLMFLDRHRKLLLVTCYFLKLSARRGHLPGIKSS